MSERKATAFIEFSREVRELVNERLGENGHTFTNRESQEAVRAVIDVINSNLKDGKEIRLPNLPIIKIVEVKERKSRNPYRHEDGTVTTVPAVRKAHRTLRLTVPKFHKELLNP